MVAVVIWVLVSMALPYLVSYVTLRQYRILGRYIRRMRMCLISWLEQDTKLKSDDKDNKDKRLAMLHC
jgi:hypothetical protein